jgi:hypothetical protein
VTQKPAWVAAQFSVVPLSEENWKAVQVSAKAIKVRTLPFYFFLNEWRVT